MQQQDFKKLLEKFSKGECSKVEEDIVLGWYENVQHDGQFEQNQEQYKLIEAKIWSSLKPLTTTKQHVNRFTFVRIAAAIALFAFASVTLLFVLNIFRGSELLSVSSKEGDTNSQTITIVNSNKTPFTLKLDDGSEVTLQPRSEIRYPKTFGNQREVHLSGEAFFKINRDTLHPFLVYSEEVVTRVLGTSFTVKAYKYEKEITVSVQTGKVSVYCAKDDNSSKLDEPGDLSLLHELILIPNQQVVYQRDSHNAERNLVEKPEIILSKATLMEMQYDGAPVVKILDVLMENYGVDIKYDAQKLTNCTLTTSLNNEGLYERINVICKAIGATYEIVDTVIYIKSNGCN